MYHKISIEILILVPCFSFHWSLVLICIPDKEDESGLTILHLDSLKLHPTKRIVENVKRWDTRSFAFFALCYLFTPLAFYAYGLKMQIDINFTRRYVNLLQVSKLWMELSETRWLFPGFTSLETNMGKIPGYDQQCWYRG